MASRAAVLAVVIIRNQHLLHHRVHRANLHHSLSQPEWIRRLMTLFRFKKYQHHYKVLSRRPQIGVFYLYKMFVVVLFVIVSVP